jgi:outer membrane protein assembly complex protein YaeT
MRVIPAVLLVLLASTGAAAQVRTPAADVIGKPVTEVHLVSEGRPADEPALVDLIETRVGQPLSMAAVRESITHLFSLGRFQDVQVDATATSGGVALRYDLVPVHRVSRVEVRGPLGVSDGTVRSFIEDRFGATPPAGRAADVSSVLEHEFYPDHGYMQARVTPVPTLTHDPDGTLLTFDINAGPRAVIRDVTIVGDPVDGRATFQRQVNAAKGDPYEPLKIRSGLTGVVQKLKKRGRYEATATFVPNVNDDGTAVDLQFDVQPGPVVSLVFRGDALPPEKIKELAPIEREGSVDQDLLEDSTRRITDYLSAEGYWKATATSAREEGPGTATIVFTVRRGLLYRIAPGGVEIGGNRQIPIEQLRPQLERLQPGAIYTSANLGAAVGAIALDYAKRGFATVKITPAQNELNAVGGVGQVKPVIVIDEGPLTRIGDITFQGNRHMSAEELRAEVSELGAHDPYYEPTIAASRNKVLLAYLNAGFSSATVVLRPVLSEDHARADLQFQITEGPQSIVDHIIIVGNTRTDPRIIQRELRFTPGGPLGLADKLESRRRLGALGLFRRIGIDELPPSAEGRRDVVVTVEEAAATTLSYGGGLEITRRLMSTVPGEKASQQFDFGPRGFFDIGRRNIAGKNRSVNLFTRLALRPDNATTTDPTTDPGVFGFVEYRVVGAYREPRALGMRNADLTVTAVVEQGVRTSFNFKRQGVNADVTRPFSPRIRGNVRYSFSKTRTFDEQLTEKEQFQIDKAFPEVRLSSFSGGVLFDSRDDVLEPARGSLLTGDVTLAARALGGEVGFLKSYMQGSWFHGLPGRRRIVFATRAAVGLADGFPRVATIENADGTTSPAIIEDLPASERFFAGGGSTIRGFGLDEVGAPNTISPTTGFPTGGNAVLIMNVEVRVPVPIIKGMGIAAFVDGGNVFRRVTEFDFGELRGSYGVGLRYRSPIGPLSFDVGFKMDRRVIGGTLEPPMAFHFSFGQAF